LNLVRVMKNHELLLTMLEDLTNFVVDSIKNAKTIDEGALKVISAEVEKFINILMATGFTLKKYLKILLNKAKIIITLELARARFEVRTKFFNQEFCITCLSASEFFP